MGDGVKAYRSISADGSIALSKTQQYPLKTQAAYGVDWGFHLFFGDTFGISALIGYDTLFPSSLDTGFSYKGFSALNSGLSLTIRTPLAAHHSGGTSFFLGSSAGMEGSFARYTDLPHYFFYLAAVMEPLLDIVPLPEGRWFIRAGMPLVFRFRKDTSLSMSAGFSLHLFHEPALRARE